MEAVLNNQKKTRQSTNTRNQ